MKRREFLKQGTVVAGLASLPNLTVPSIAGQSRTQKPSRPQGQSEAAPEEIRSAQYLRRARADEYLPKPPVLKASHLPSGTAVSPMPLAERIKRNIVPRRGFCSIAPASDALLISGNGRMTIDTSCDPYSEQIVFRHESVFVPHQPSAAPDIAGILPQVRQMLLEGKYHEAAKFAYEEWHKRPMPPGGGFGGGPAFSMQLDFPKTASVKNYLRTVDFESTELKIHWTDEHGEWTRRTFTSRPDNVVVQWLTAPQGQSVNVRIALQRSAGGIFGGMGGFGASGLGAPLVSGAGMPGAPGFDSGMRGGAQGEFHQDFNEQRLIFKGKLDP